MYKSIDFLVQAQGLECTDQKATLSLHVAVDHGDGHGNLS